MTFNRDLWRENLVRMSESNLKDIGLIRSDIEGILKNHRPPICRPPNRQGIGKSGGDGA